MTEVPHNLTLEISRVLRHFVTLLKLLELACPEWTILPKVQGMTMKILFYPGKALRIYSGHLARPPAYKGVAMFVVACNRLRITIFNPHYFYQITFTG